MSNNEIKNMAHSVNARLKNIAMKRSQWNAFLRKINPAKRPDTLADTAHGIARLLQPIIQPSIPGPSEWIAGQGWK